MMLLLTTVCNYLFNYLFDADIIGLNSFGYLLRTVGECLLFQFLFPISLYPQ